ncbi:hypothetical protein NQ318_016691, partial [Aromia moschata]
HARFASVPVGTAQGRQLTAASAAPAAAGFAVHARNASEPFTKYQNNGPTMAQQGIAIAAANHQRHSSQVDQSQSLHQQIQHFRSSSVPKCIPLTVARHEGGTAAVAATTTTGVHLTTPPRLSQKPPPQMHNNVSNVNVNFYRAVPVNVVSSVPTIQCLNSLSNAQGNSVSNVQVLPLGAANFQTSSANVFQANFPATSLSYTHSIQNNNSSISGTTQVILHNAALPTTNSIQIPSSFQPRSTVFNNPQVVSVQMNRNTHGVLPAAAAASDVYWPGFLHGGRPASNPAAAAPTVTVQQNNESQQRARSYSNAAINTVPTATGVQQQQATQPKVARTFTSTEAQTDETSASLPTSGEPSSGVREQRRRERRERRQQRRATGAATHRHTADSGTQIGDSRLPDILNSHLPPPYSTLPGGMHNHGVLGAMPPMVPPPQMVPPPPMLAPPPHGAVLQSVVPNSVVPPSGFVFPGPQAVVPGQVPLVQGPAPVAVPVPPPSGFRFPFPANGFR